MENKCFLTKMLQDLLSKGFLVWNSIHRNLRAFLPPLPLSAFSIPSFIISFIHTLLIYKLTIVLYFTVPKPQPPKCPKKLIRKCFLVKYGKSRRIVCSCVKRCPYHYGDESENDYKVSEQPNKRYRT